MTPREQQISGLLKDGLTYKEIERLTGCDAHNVRKVAIKFGQTYTDEARRRAQLEHVRKTVHDIGAEYVSGYENNKSLITIRLDCGHYANLLWSTVTDAKKWKRSLACDECRRIEREKKEREKELARIKREAQRNTGEQLTYTICPVCGAASYTVSRYCSKKCREKVRRKNKEVRRRIRETAGSHDTDITVASLYRRDGGICWICGEPCDYTDSQETETAFIAGNNYPTIDHVIPLAKGGTHTWDNVKLAHMRCNWMKRDNIIPPVDF
jgi:5-methylcytosine-specific restriction endonuclease McrA